MKTNQGTHFGTQLLISSIGEGGASTRQPFRLLTIHSGPENFPQRRRLETGPTHHGLGAEKACQKKKAGRELDRRVHDEFPQMERRAA
jgi:hypothetical protein